VVDPSPEMGELLVHELKKLLGIPASACTVEAVPKLCRLSSAPIVRFDDIMEALKKLDGPAAETPCYQKFINRARRLKALYRSDRGDPRPLFA